MKVHRTIQKIDLICDFCGRPEHPNAHWSVRHSTVDLRCPKDGLNHYDEFKFDLCAVCRLELHKVLKDAVKELKHVHTPSPQD